MNRIGWRLFAAALALSLSAQLQAESYGGLHDRAVAHFMSTAEPRVKDALWTTPRILKLGMIDDGSRRDGFAEYACQVLVDMGFKGEGVSVQIIDIVKVTRQGKWVRLGKANCP